MVFVEQVKSTESDRLQVSASSSDTAGRDRAMLLAHTEETAKEASCYC